MGNGAKITIIIAALLTLVFAIKPYYGGEVVIRLNEPPNFVYTPSDYSNLVFYSLLYENLFYMAEDGDVYSNLFRDFRYDAAERTLVMELKKNISFSNGDPIEADNIKFSIRLFMEMKIKTAAKLRGIVKSITTGGHKVMVELLYDTPDIAGLLSAPELVLLSGTGGSFSGMFYPVEWEKGSYIKLRPNLYYPGGRTYLDGVKVIFYDYMYPDLFLSQPGNTVAGFRETPAGVYQNVYLGFPGQKVSTNKRLALYSALRDFAAQKELTHLNALTSDDESPVTLNIKQFPSWKIRALLKRSPMKLYILSSLKDMEEELRLYLSGKGIRRLETIFLSDNRLADFMEHTPVDYLVLVKVFNKRTPIDEKIATIIREMSFARFDAGYLKMLSELEEVKLLKDDELLIDQVSRIIEKIVNDGFLLPLFQRRFSLYSRNNVAGLALDYYGRPLFRKMRLAGKSAATVPAPPAAPAPADMETTEGDQEEGGTENNQTKRG